MQSKGNVAFSGFRNTHWLRYSISKDTVYCPSCVVFGSNDSRDKKQLFIYPGKRLVKHSQHEVMSSHTAKQQTATHFLDDQSKTSET